MSLPISASRGSTSVPLEASDPLGRFWRRTRPGRRELRNDAILAVVLLACTAVSTALYDSVGMYEVRPELWASALWVIAITLPLALRRLHPEVVAIVLSTAFIVGATVHVAELLFCNIALFIAIYTVGAWSRHRLRANVVRGLIIFAMFVWLYAALVQTSGAGVLAPDAFPDAPEGALLPPALAFGLVQIVTNLLYFGGAYYFGNRAWQSARDRSALESRTAELATERERVAEQAVALERVRIARELHDVVAHHVSVMGVHAGAARRVVDRDPARAKDSLGIIETHARSTIEELHRMLTALRSDEATDPGGADAGAPASRSASTRGVAQLDELVSQARAAGLAVSMEVVGHPRPLPPVVDVIVYRVAQEALTNVHKHASPDAPVDLRVRFLPHAVELEVTDDGIGAVNPARTSGSRLGHVGMRERVAAVGGEITIGPRARGGFRVRAMLPAPGRRAE